MMKNNENKEVDAAANKGSQMSTTADSEVLYKNGSLNR